MLRTLMLTWIIGLVGCGLQESRYEPYEGPEDTKTEGTAAASGGEDGTTGEEDSCQSTADGLFTQLVAPAISKACSSCHGPGGTANGAMALVGGSDAENAKNLYAFTGSDASKLNDFIGPSGSHGGGDQSDTLTGENVSSWVSGQAECE